MNSTIIKNEIQSELERLNTSLSKKKYVVKLVEIRIEIYQLIILLKEFDK